MGYWEDLQGTILDDRYELLRLIGTGGFGAVYEADDLDFSDRVAVKVMQGELAHRVRREGVLGKRFRHPNAVNIENVSFDSDPPYLVMEFLDGPTLDTVEQLSDAEMLTFVQQIGSSLQQAHDQNLVHRDLKPQNIIFSKDRKSGQDRFVILDFGIASQTDDGGTLRGATMDGAGTPEYMAPEQMQGEAPTPKSDIYAFGVLLYRLLTGRVPFPCEQKSLVTYFRYINEEAPPRFKEALPGRPIDPLVEAIVLRCLSKSAQGRPDSLNEIIEAFEDVYGVAESADVEAESDPDDSELQPPATPASIDTGEPDGKENAAPPVANTDSATDTDSVPATEPDDEHDTISLSEQTLAPSYVQPQIPPVATNVPPEDLPPVATPPVDLPPNDASPVPSMPVAPPESPPTPDSDSLSTLQPPTEPGVKPWNAGVQPATSAPHDVPQDAKSPSQEHPQSAKAPDTRPMFGLEKVPKQPEEQRSDKNATMAPGTMFGDMPSGNEQAGMDAYPDADITGFAGSANRSVPDSQSTPPVRRMARNHRQASRGPTLIVAAVVVALIVVAAGYPFIQKRRLEHHVATLAGAGQYQLACSAVQDVDAVTKFTIEPKTLLAEIQKTGLVRMEGLIESADMPTMMQELEEFHTAFPESDALQPLLKSMADTIRTQVSHKISSEGFEPAVVMIDRDPVIGRLENLAPTVLSRAELKAKTRGEAIDKLERLTSESRFAEAIRLGQDLHAFVFPNDPQILQLTRQATIARPLQTAEKERSIGNFSSAVEEYSGALGLDLDAQQTQNILLKRAEVHLEWADQTAADPRIALQQVEAGLADAGSVLTADPARPEARTLAAALYRQSAALQWEDTPYQAICELRIALKLQPDSDAARSLLQQIADRHSQKGAVGIMTARDGNAANPSDDIDARYSAVIDHLNLSIFAQDNPPSELYYGRGIARSELTHPDYRGAAADLSEFIRQTQKTLQVLPEDDRGAQQEREFQLAIARSRLAWIKATSPDDAGGSIRDGAVAVQLAEAAVRAFEALFEVTSNEIYLHELSGAQTSLAAAFAEAGDFRKALRVAKAVQVRFPSDSSEWATHENTIRQFYQQDRPFRDPRPPSQSVELKPCDDLPGYLTTSR